MKTQKVIELLGNMLFHFLRPSFAPISESTASLSLLRRITLLFLREKGLNSVVAGE